MGLVGTRRWLSSYRQLLVGGADLLRCTGSRVHLSPWVANGGQALSGAGGLWAGTADGAGPALCPRRPGDGFDREGGPVGGPGAGFAG